MGGTLLAAERVMGVTGLVRGSTRCCLAIERHAGGRARTRMQMKKGREFRPF